MQRLALPARIAPVFLLLLSALSTVAASNPWTTDDLMGCEKIVNLAVSRTDPRIVVWEKSTPNQDKNEYVSHLFRHGPGPGTEAIQLTRGQESCTRPRFAPDGRLIAFLSARPSPKSKGPEEGDSEADRPKAQIWLLDQGEPYPLTELDRTVKDFAWRDTNRLVFIAQESPAQ